MESKARSRIFTAACLSSPTIAFVEYSTTPASFDSWVNIYTGHLSYPPIQLSRIESGEFSLACKICSYQVEIYSKRHNGFIDWGDPMQAKRITNEDWLRSFIETHHDALLKSVRLYVMRFGLTDRVSAENVAYELLNEVVVEAFNHANRLKDTGQTHAWLLGITLNLIKRKRANLARLHQREPLISDLYANNHHDLSGEEFIENLALPGMTNPEEKLLHDDTITTLLSQLSDRDQRVIRMAILQGFKGEALAHQLGVSLGASYVQVHRALKRLRAVYFRIIEDE